MKHSDDGRIAITREELHALVWKTPMSRLAGQFGLSDVGLAKVCNKHNIPRPGPGHWTRLQHGKSSPETALPSLPDDESSLIEFVPQRRSLGGQGSGSSGSDQGGIAVVPVPRTLTNPHPLIGSVLTSLKGARPNEDGLLVPVGEDALDVIVSPSCQNRALRIMQALILSVEAVDGSVGTEKVYSGSKTMAILSGEAISFGLTEAVLRKKRPPTSAELRANPWLRHRSPVDRTPTGKLVLTVTQFSTDGTRRRWADGKKQRLEDLLPRFIRSLCETAEELKRQRLLREEHQRQREERARAEAERRRLVQEEEARVQNLLSAVDAWHMSLRIRSFVDEVVKQGERGHGPFSEAESRRTWAGWATRQADRLDPLRAAPPSAPD